MKPNTTVPNRDGITRNDLQITKSSKASIISLYVYREIHSPPDSTTALNQTPRTKGSSRTAILLTCSTNHASCSCTQSCPVAQKLGNKSGTAPLNPPQLVALKWQQRPPRPALVLRRDALSCTQIDCHHSDQLFHELFLCMWAKPCASGFRGISGIKLACHVVPK